MENLKVIQLESLSDFTYMRSLLRNNVHLRHAYDITTDKESKVNKEGAKFIDHISSYILIDIEKLVANEASSYRIYKDTYDLWSVHKLSCYIARKYSEVINERNS